MCVLLEHMEQGQKLAHEYALRDALKVANEKDVLRVSEVCSLYDLYH